MLHIHAALKKIKNKTDWDAKWKTNISVAPSEPSDISLSPLPLCLSFLMHNMPSRSFALPSLLFFSAEHWIFLAANLFRNVWRCEPEGTHRKCRLSAPRRLLKACVPTQVIYKKLKIKIKMLNGRNQKGHMVKCEVAPWCLTANRKV